MSILPQRSRRLAGAVVAGMALALVPAATQSAGAVPVAAQVAVEAPAPASGLRLVTDPTPEKGEITVAWNASTSPDVIEYGVYIETYGGWDWVIVDAEDPLTYTFTGLDDNEPVLVEVYAMTAEEGVWSEPVRLRATTLGEGEVLPFTDTAGNTFEYEIDWFSSTGATTGYDAGDSVYFDPSGPVLREQMAAFIFRLANAYGEYDEYEPPTTSPFVDVPTTHTFYREIAWMEDMGLSTGYYHSPGNRAFAPSEPVLREQMAAFIYRGWDAEYDHGGGVPSFTDTPASSTFFDEIEWLALVDITTGYLEPNGTRTFRGGQPVLREQMAAFMYRASSIMFDESYWGPEASLTLAEEAPLSPVD